ncbi:sensor histidine kinase [Actinokineospora soli]|uniref:histidine kinase n=1 Tax=Actinokineospora soli TaxID=1048753 RepID=A0ABW2TUL1_9PSEU
MTNVRKHADASHAELVLDYTDPVVRLDVRDDGTGTATGDGYGLVGLRERAAHVGGSLRAGRAPGEGWTLTMEVPG